MVPVLTEKYAMKIMTNRRFSEFINSGNGSTLTGGCKQLSQFINSESDAPENPPSPKKATEDKGGAL